MRRMITGDRNRMSESMPLVVDQNLHRKLKTRRVPLNRQMKQMKVMSMGDDRTTRLEPYQGRQAEAEPVGLKAGTRPQKAQETVGTM